jgi:hypothetical protein
MIKEIMKLWDGMMFESINGTKAPHIRLIITSGGFLIIEKNNEGMGWDNDEYDLS